MRSYNSKAICALLIDQMKNRVQEPAHNDFHSRLDGATFGRLALAAKGVLVEQVLGQLVVLSIHA